MHKDNFHMIYLVIYFSAGEWKMCVKQKYTSDLSEIFQMLISTMHYLTVHYFVS